MVEEEGVSPTLPEYILRRCRICGDFYKSAGEYIEVGLCRYCAKGTGRYASSRVV